MLDKLEVRKQLLLQLIQSIKSLKVASSNYNTSCKKTFYFTDINLSTAMSEQVDFIETNIEQFVITDTGNRNYRVEDILIESCGITFKVLEQDSFGPLRMGLVIGYGIIPFG
jgi:hypothetical protein